MSTQLDAATRGELTMDPAHTLVEFSARHMMITNVKGRFREVSGTILLDQEDPSRSAVTVEMVAASIDTGVDPRDAHLRSSDFLDAEHYPLLQYRSRSVEGGFHTPGDRFRMVGELTIRGVTRDVVLDATYEGRAVEGDGTERLSFSAETRIDRRDFGLTWNQALEAGGVLVGNEVKIYLQVQAVRS